MLEPQPLESLPFVWPLVGGLLVGLSAGLYLLLNRRVAPGRPSSSSAR